MILVLGNQQESLSISNGTGQGPKKGGTSFVVGGRAEKITRQKWGVVFGGVFGKLFCSRRGLFTVLFQYFRNQPARNFDPVLFQASEKCFGLFFLLFLCFGVDFW